MVNRTVIRLENSDSKTFTLSGNVKLGGDQVDLI